MYTDTSEFSDTSFFDGLPEALIEQDGPLEELFTELNAEQIENDGFLASTSLVYDAGATRYSARFAVDVLPSSVGSRVETNELTGQLDHKLSRRLDFSLRARAFEPDRLGATPDNDFARRFISFEPRIQWKYTRNWTVSAAYRYRRQRARSAPESAESNAVLFAIKYTPPSKIRDRAAANGL